MSDTEQTASVGTSAPVSPPSPSPTPASMVAAASAQETPAENVHIRLLNKLRVSRRRRISDPGTACATPASSVVETARKSASQRDSGAAEALSSCLWRLHVADRPAAAAAAAAAGCTCLAVSGAPGGRCQRSPGGCRRRLLLLRPARLKPARRPLLREPRLLRRQVGRGAAAAAAAVFGAATAADRCSEFSQVKGAAVSDEGAAAAAAAVAAAAGAAGAEFAGAGAPVFGASPADGCAAVPTAAAAPVAAGADGSASPPSCSVQHRQRRPASVDELAGLVSQVTIMSSMAEMMYT